MRFDKDKAAASAVIFGLTFTGLFFFMVFYRASPELAIQLIVAIGTLCLIYLVGGYVGKDE